MINPGLHEIKHNSLVYDGKTSRVFSIFIVNILLNIITLSIYRFWGRTVMRKYLWSGVSLEKDRVEYIGTGKELLWGFLKGMLFLSLFFIFIVFISHALSRLIPGVDKPILYAAILFISLAAYYGALRYKISRTTWRGIRWRLLGSAASYASLVLWRWCLNIFTLGIIIPFSDVIIYRYITDHLAFGETGAHFDGEVTPELTKTNLITLALFIPTLGISRFWYQAAWMRYRLRHTTIGDLSFEGTHSGGNLARLIVGNMAIFIVTLGFGLPFILQRNMRYLVDHLLIVGDIDTSNVVQSNKELAEGGEGLAQALDGDIGFV